jgi:hypothetical protein
VGRPSRSTAVTDAVGRDCKTSAGKEELEGHFSTLLEYVQPTTEVLLKLPTIAARTWEVSKEQIAEDARTLTRLEEQRAVFQ